MSIPIPIVQSTLRRNNSSLSRLSEGLSRTLDATTGDDFLRARCEEEVMEGYVDFLELGDPTDGADTPKGLYSSADAFGALSYKPRYLEMQGGLLRLYEVAAPGSGMRRGKLLVSVGADGIHSLRSRSQVGKGPSVGFRGSTTLPASTSGGGAGGAQANPPEFTLLVSPSRVATSGGIPPRVLWNIRVDTLEKLNNWLFYFMRAMAVVLEGIRGTATLSLQRQQQQQQQQTQQQQQQQLQSLLQHPPFLQQAAVRGGGQSSYSGSLPPLPPPILGGFGGGGSSAASNGEEWAASSAPKFSFSRSAGTSGLGGPSSLPPRPHLSLPPNISSSYSGGSGGGGLGRGFLFGGGGGLAEEDEEEEDEFAVAAAAAAAVGRGGGRGGVRRGGGGARLSSGSFSSGSGSDEEGEDGESGSGDEDVGGRGAVRIAPLSTNDSVFDDEGFQFGGNSPSLLHRHPPPANPLSTSSHPPLHPSTTTLAPPPSTRLLVPSLKRQPSLDSPETSEGGVEEGSLYSSSSLSIGGSSTTDAAGAAGVGGSGGGGSGGGRYIPPHKRTPSYVSDSGGECSTPNPSGNGPQTTTTTTTSSSSSSILQRATTYDIIQAAGVVAATAPPTLRPPNLSKTSFWDGSGSQVHGVWASQGVRAQMEDAHVALEGIGSGGGGGGDDLFHGLPPLPEAIFEALGVLKGVRAAGGATSLPTLDLLDTDFITTPSPSAAAIPTDAQSPSPHPLTNFYAVFDGHGGRLVADYAAASLPRRLLRHPAFHSTHGGGGGGGSVAPDEGGGGVRGLMTSLRDAFLETDQAFLTLANAMLDASTAAAGAAAVGVGGGAGVESAIPPTPAPVPPPLSLKAQAQWLSGSTALVACIRGGRDLVVASLGDCRGVLATPQPPPHCSANVGCTCTCTYSAQALNKEHTPASEAPRIEAAGGWVVETQEFSRPDVRHMDTTHPFVARRIASDGARLMRWTSVSQVNSDLSVARALGDTDFKGERMRSYPWFWPRGVTPRDFSADLVLGEPELGHWVIPQVGGSGSGGGSGGGGGGGRTCCCSTALAASSGGGGSGGGSSSGGGGGGGGGSGQCCTPFLILACDGLWEVLSSQEAVEIVAGALRGAAAIGTSHGEHEHLSRYSSEGGVGRGGGGGGEAGGGESNTSTSTSTSSQGGGSRQSVGGGGVEDTPSSSNSTFTSSSSSSFSTPSPTLQAPIVAARHLVDIAIRLGTSDNVSAIVVLL